MTGRAAFNAYRASLARGVIDAEAELSAFAAVRDCLARIEASLRSMGYLFACEQDTPHGGPLNPPMRQTSLGDLARLLAFDDGAHPVPHLIKAIALLVGEVDFRQCPEQCRGNGPLAGLGEHDPFFFETIYGLATLCDVLAEPDLHLDLRFEFAPDAFHKADISGGEGYAIALSDNRLDPLVHLGGTTFLDLLDRWLTGGGFLGALKHDLEMPLCGHDATRRPLPEPFASRLTTAAGWS